MTSKPNELQLPLSVISPVDVGRLTREVEALEDFFRQAKARAPGSPTNLPRLSHMLDELVEHNKLNLLQAEQRQQVLTWLQAVKAQAPTLHVSFGADPSPLFLQKFTQYLRDHIHPLVLLRVGLQPNLGAGCVVRTTNKYFDFSLRERLLNERPRLLELLRKVTV